MKSITLTEEEYNLLMGYLSKRPWGEVNQVVVPIINKIAKVEQDGDNNNRSDSNSPDSASSTSTNKGKEK